MCPPDLLCAEHAHTGAQYSEYQPARLGGESGAFTTVGWQITLCDLIDKWHPVVLR